MEAKAKDRQSLLDMALQTAGSMEAAFGIAEASGLALTDTLQDGQTLETVKAVDGTVVRRYRAQGVEPATALSDEEMERLAQEGINFMGIEIDFTVS